MSKSNIIIDTNDYEELSGDDDIIDVGDGNVVVNLDVKRKEKPNRFDDNLALEMDAGSLGVIAEQLMQGIEADIKSRQERQNTRQRGIELLGLKLEEPRTDIGSSASGVEGMSTYRDPALLEAVLRGSANASGELLPADGPVKIKNVGTGSVPNDSLAEDFEKDFNHYLTDIATEYYPDTKRMLFWTYFGGSGWKKVYSCPIRRRPVAESIDEDDLIISNGATDLWNAGRITHKITMRPSVMKRMQYLGVYRAVALGQPTPSTNQVDQAKQNVEGVRPNQDRPEDQPYTLYECYCEIDLDQYAPMEFKGEGIPLPYRVTIDKDSRQILEVHRNWKEDDAAALPRKYFVKYPYVEGMGIYGIGLLHIMGNAVNAITAAIREMLDAGMFANFPGFIYAKQTGRQLTNEFRVPPGGGVAIDTGQSGDVSKSIMPLPYKDITPGLMNLTKELRENTKSVGNMADLPVGEGKQDAPVGTTIALIEQATKIESAVHKGLHKAQAEEFQLLKERFKEDPEAFWRHHPNCTSKWTKERFLQALENCELIPVADPNTPSHMHRVAKGVAVKQMQMAAPALYDAKKVDTWIGQSVLKIGDFDQFFAPPPPPGGTPDPKEIEAKAKMITAQTDQAKAQFENQNSQGEMVHKAAERKSKEDIAAMHLASTIITQASDEKTAQIKAESEQFKAKSQHALEVAKETSSHGITAQKQQHDMLDKDRRHGLDMQKHAVDAASKANKAMVDTKKAFDPPKPAAPKGKGK